MPASAARQSAATAGLRHLALVGVCDIANYGDQLFPLIAAHRLAARGVAVTAVAPGAEHRLRPDAMAPQNLDWLLAGEAPLDGILIGGGNILYNLRADYLARPEARESWLGAGMHTGLWLGAALAAALRDCPFGFNAPGLPYPFSSATARQVLRPVLQAADLCALRDRASARLAAASGVAVEVVPDTAIEIARMWPRESLAAPAAAIAARGGWGGGPHVTVHLRAAPGQAAQLRAVAAQLDRFCAEQQLHPLLLVIGEDLGDGETARQLAAAMTVPATVLPGDCPLRDVAAAIAGARLYLGGSLHGYITAAAYGVPGVLMTAQPQRKFAGFLEWMQRPDDLAASWEEACALAAGHLAGGAPVQVPEAVWQALDAHWQAVEAMLAAQHRRAAERAAMLRALLARGAGRGGVDWLMAAWPARQGPGVAA